MTSLCRSGSPPKLESVFLLFVVVTVGQIMTGRRLLQSLSGSPLWLTYSLRSTLWITYGNLPKKCWLHLRFSCKVALFNSTNFRRKRKIIGSISQFLTGKCFCKKYKLQGLRRLEIEISETQRLGFFKSIT